MKKDECEFSEEIARLRRINAELERALQSKDAEILALRERKDSEIKTLEFSIHNLLKQVDELTALKNSEAEKHRQAIQVYIDKTKDLEQELVKEQRDHFFEKARMKAVAGKKKAKNDVKNLKRVNSIIKNPQDLEKQAIDEQDENVFNCNYDEKSEISVYDDGKGGDSRSRAISRNDGRRTPNKMSFDEQIPQNSERHDQQNGVANQAHLIKVIENLQFGIKCLEHDKAQMASEIDNLVQMTKETDRERYHLHNQVLQLEEEKMEILQHFENFKGLNNDLEEKCNRLLRGNAKLEVDLGRFSNTKVSDETEMQKLKTQIADVNLKLNELQLQHNKLISEHKESLMDFDSKNQRSKKYVAQLEAEMKSLVQTVRRLEEELKDAGETYRKLEAENMDLKIEVEKNNSWKEWQENRRVTELTKTVDELNKELSVQKQENVRLTMVNIADFKDPKFLESLAQNDKIPEEGDDPSVFSFTAPRHEGLQMIEFHENEPLMDNMSDRFERNSQQSALDKLKRGSISFLPNFEHPEGDQVAQTPEEKNSERSRKKSKVESPFDAIKKRFSVSKPGQEIKSKFLNTHRFSLAGVESQALDRLKKLGLTKDADCSDYDSSDNSSEDGTLVKQQVEAENEKVRSLFEQLHQKNETIGSLQSEVEQLKSQVSSLSTELHLAQMKLAAVQQSFEMFEQVHIAHVTKAQAELDAMTKSFIESKILANEIQTEKDLMQMKYAKTIRAKDFEIESYKRQFEESEYKRGGRMTTLARI